MDFLVYYGSLLQTTLQRLLFYTLSFKDDKSNLFPMTSLFDWFCALPGWWVKRGEVAERQNKREGEGPNSPCMSSCSVEMQAQPKFERLSLASCWVAVAAASCTDSCKHAQDTAHQSNMPQIKTHNIQNQQKHSKCFGNAYGLVYRCGARHCLCSFRSP
jgi:hypothetical protein